MTQVKEWSNQELNRKLAELMGWTEFKEDGHGGIWAVAPDYRWTNKMPDYCEDPAASLEVQAKAIEVSAGEYVINLQKVVYTGNVNETISALLNATPRQRAEAAYITLSSK
ncbi:hypothetical protein [Paenibacillus sp. FSL L8-0463]|uniref:hypothetical protein n=1 Tax=Paenibacillus sp. FSL L8-0463 TaxID=2954687 RepID=UPI00311A18CB